MGSQRGFAGRCSVLASSRHLPVPHMRRWSLLASMTAVLLSAAAPPVLNDLTSFALMRSDGPAPVVITLSSPSAAPRGNAVAAASPSGVQPLFSGSSG